MGRSRLNRFGDGDVKPRLCVSGADCEVMKSKGLFIHAQKGDRVNRQFPSVHTGVIDTTKSGLI